MAVGAEERLGAGAGLVATLIIGVSVLATGTLVDDEPLATAGWWVA